MSRKLAELLEPTTFPHMLAMGTANSKLGPGWCCTYRPLGITCPASCPLADDGCYVKHTHAFHQQVRARTRRDPLAPALGAPLVRHLVSGDVMCGREVDRPYLRHVASYHELSPKTVGLLYTHAWRKILSWIKHKPRNLHVLASVDSVAEAERAQSLGLRTARVTTSMDVRKGETYCPVDLLKWQGEAQRHTCSTCRKCFECPKNIVFMKV